MGSANSSSASTSSISSEKQAEPAVTALSSRTPAKGCQKPRSSYFQDHTTSSSASPPSSPSMELVQTPCGGWIILKEPGQDHINEADTCDEGVWDLLLGVDEQGVALAEAEVEMLRGDYTNDMVEGGW